MFHRTIDSFRLDKTYSFQTYAIIAFPEGIDKSSVSCSDCDQCSLKKWCTIHVPYIAQKRISFQKVADTMQKDLIVPSVYWAHTGQASFEEMFMTWHVDKRTLVFAENQRAGLRVRREKSSDIIEFCGLELENFRTRDIDFILYLAHGFQQCTDTPLYLCTKGRQPKLLPLDSDLLKDWLAANATDKA